MTLEVSGTCISVVGFLDYLEVLMTAEVDFKGTLERIVWLGRLCRNITRKLIPI